ncbi:Hypothetical protein FKW44_019767, partial [Caligus rogercresseyi]
AKSIGFASLNSKAWIANCISQSNRVVRNDDLRKVIIISAAATYSTLTLKMPSLLDDSWTNAAASI